jgi:hypothetical protein
MPDYDPTQEEWKVDGTLLYSGSSPAEIGPGRQVAVFAGPQIMDARARARLASAAPAFARLWIKHEFCAGRYDSRCPECGGLEPDEYTTRGTVPTGHLPDCALLAAFKQSGLR